MTKNVIVVDELGNEYAPTYAKRARGLVKQGRARWLDENTICLACPPNDIDLEDNVMNNQDKIADVMENIEVVTTEVQHEEVRITAAEVLARMDKIIAQGEELTKAIHLIHDLPVNDSPEGGRDGEARANAIRDICIRREVTNQKMLDMLEEMLHHRKSNSSMVDKALSYDFTGVLDDTAKHILDFIERHS